MMSQPDILTLAKQGETRVIAFLLNQTLQTENITATVILKSRCLHVLLEASQVPDQNRYFDFVFRSISSLDLKNISSLRVYGRQIGQAKPAWNQLINFDSSHGSPQSFINLQRKLIFRKKTHQPLNVSLVNPYKFTKVNPKFLAIGSFLSFLIGLNWDFFGNFGTGVSTFGTARIGEILGSLPRSVPSIMPLFASVNTPTLALKSPNLNGLKILSENVTKKAPEGPITFKAVGDIIPGTNFPSYRLPPQKELLFASVKSSLQGADILFGNFESTLTNYPRTAKDISRGRVFAFRTPPEYAELLKTVGFDVLSVANNHSMDFSEVGFQDTIKHIENAGMKAVGAKEQILYMTVKNIPVAFIAFSNYDYHNSMNDLEAAKALVEKAKEKASIIVISVHAGAEGTGAMHVRNQTEMFYGENRGNLVLFAHTMIDAGADIIFGHGPHVPRAIELYQGKLIAYSLGNFVGYRSLSTVAELGYSLILEATLNPEGDFLEGQIIPVHMTDQGIPYLDKKFRTVELIRRLNKSDFPKNTIMIDQDGKISKQGD